MCHLSVQTCTILVALKCVVYFRSFRTKQEELNLDEGRPGQVGHAVAGGGDLVTGSGVGLVTG